jgi:hypothetical protein
MFPQLNDWSSVLGNTCGFIDPNVSWFKYLPDGNVVEVWQNIESPGWSATLNVPGVDYKPGQLYLSGEMLSWVRFDDWAELAATGWFGKAA